MLSLAEQPPPSLLPCPLPILLTTVPAQQVDICCEVNCTACPESDGVGDGAQGRRGDKLSCSMLDRDTDDLEHMLGWCSACGLLDQL